jgi:hypothetical protein
VTDAEFYMESPGGIVKRWITAKRAAEVHDEQKDGKYFSGDLASGFEYWESGYGTDRFMLTTVMPVLSSNVPESVKKDLADGAPSVLAP